MESRLIPISEAARILGVSIDTLRRWDKSGKLPSTKKPGGVHRYYSFSGLEKVMDRLVPLGLSWAEGSAEISPEYYCQTSATFQARLDTLQALLLARKFTVEYVGVIISVAGEIGNNSFDHNLGHWKDVPGVFFGYNIDTRVVVMADRGQGVLASLKRVRPALIHHTDALRAAFTEVVSGRAPETRGNGLKFVRESIKESDVTLLFRSGDAEVFLKRGQERFTVQTLPTIIPGTFAKITF